jgi:hypothetical protein
MVFTSIFLGKEVIMDIISAIEASDLSTMAENHKKAILRQQALEVLEHESFNERVKVAAAVESWKLGNPIKAPNVAVADAIRTILTELGYQVEVERTDWNSEAGANVRVSWKRIAKRNESALTAASATTMDKIESTARRLAGWED